MQIFGLDIEDTATNYTVDVARVKGTSSDRGYIGRGLADTVGEIFIGIIGRGCFIFDLSKEWHAGYMSEKLNIDPDSAKFVADFVQGLFNREEI